MRIISQDGKCDYPYENSILFIDYMDGRVIKIVPSTGGFKGSNIATYSTEENAVKAMEGAQVKAHAGSDSVAKVAQSLNVIAGEVGTINDMNTQIATAAEEQSAVAEEINRNVTTISVIADTTSNDAQQTSQISEELVRLAAELNRLVGQFKL